MTHFCQATALTAVEEASDRSPSPGPEPLPERFLTAAHLADILGVHENYIYDLAARGILPSYKIGGNRRFRWSEIEDWLDSQRNRSYDTAGTA